MKKSRLWVFVGLLTVICGAWSITCWHNGKDKAIANPADKVLIGIAWRADTNSTSYKNTIRAITEVGGTPVLLEQVIPKGYTLEGTNLAPEYTDEQGVLLQQYADEVKTLAATGSNVIETLDKVNAVVFTGGEDISPTLFRKPEPWHGIEEDKDVNATRDVSDYLTMAYCLDKDMPVLALCRGMQVLGVVSGATMIQDIPTYMASRGISYENMHRAIKKPELKRDHMPHDVKVTTHQSLLYMIAATDVITNTPSWHHQCIGSVSGTPLRVTGLTNTQGIDIIEAIERTDKTFCLGVQFHPEAAVAKHLDKNNNASQFMSYDDAIRYFKELVNQARKK